MTRKKTTINLCVFDDEATMVQTRNHRSNLAEKRDKRREERERIPPSARAERLAITKAIANEIVRKQEDLGGLDAGWR